MDNKRIIFFGSGDFPRETFLKLINNQGEYQIVGLVTSYDKCEDGGKTLKECAEENNIPTIAIRSCEGEELKEWCKSLRPNMFIVISFKKLPRTLLSLVNGRSFNVHASTLPFLKGANPIRWAIRYGMTSTGLTAIELCDKIDCGRIIDNTIVSISEDDNYGTLKNKLSERCALFTYLVMQTFEMHRPILQCTCGLNLGVLNAPKMDSSYFKINENEELTSVLKSVLPYNGIKCKLVVSKKTFNLDYLRDADEKVKEYGCTIWGLHKGIDEKPTIRISQPLFQDYIVDEIQIEGKKRMSTQEFVNGFKYTKKGEKKESDYFVTIELNM